MANSLKLKVWGQILWPLSSFSFGKKADLQAWITCQVDYLLYFLFIIAGIRYYKKMVSQEAIRA